MFLHVFACMYRSNNCPQMLIFTMNLLGKERIFTDQTKDKSNTQFSKGHPKLRLYGFPPLLLSWIIVQ